MNDLDHIDIEDLAEELAFDTADWYDDIDFEGVLPDQHK